MIKTVIFDIDDTLYDYQSGHAAAMDAVTLYLYEHFQLEKEDSLQGITESYRCIQDRLGDNAAIHNRLIRFQEFLQKRSLPIFPHAMNLAHLYWKTLIQHGTREDGIAEFMFALKGHGIRIGIGTDMTAMVQYEKLSALKLDKYIDFMTVSEQTCGEKPGKPFFDLVQSFSRCLPEECVFIGDNLRKDVDGAKSAGMHGVWYRPARRAKEDDPTDIPTISSYRECLTNEGICFGKENMAPGIKIHS